MIEASLPTSARWCVAQMVSSIRAYSTRSVSSTLRDGGCMHSKEQGLCIGKHPKYGENTTDLEKVSKEDGCSCYLLRIGC